MGDGHFTIDEKAKQIYVTERGQSGWKKFCWRRGLMQQGESLFSASNITLLHHVYAGFARP